MIGGEPIFFGLVKIMRKVILSLAKPLFSEFSLCSLMGSDSSSTNYPGKIPDGLDLPSDVADKKHQEKIANN